MTKLQTKLIIERDRLWCFALLDVLDVEKMQQVFEALLARQKTKEEFGIIDITNKK